MISLSVQDLDQQSPTKNKRLIYIGILKFIK
jgi:hypothetical protein